ncbi:MAG TPA: sugar ABC transporter permease [Actinophytocola sp.]|uniref:carbohydrate ABC transporter permease n=1 Tax=Actinophytocola sp. TaxID=1872138 RepID=UPI002DDD191F|nr:sugar ABC transporter permease [Actinophytocola sp.]HEV2781673.1 sugar ABC transporter permease [Actinophytocola sp.]
MHHRKYRFILGILVAPLALYLVFVVSPNIQAVYYSLTDWSGYSQTQNFVGLENYVRLVNDSLFWTALRNNGVLLLVLPITTISLGLLFAFLLHLGGRRRGAVAQGLRGSRLYSAVYFFPYLLSVAIIAVLWQQSYNPQGGIVPRTMSALGIDPPTDGLLGTPSTALWACIGVAVWHAVGFYVVLFSAGLASIPRDIFEAAALDGVNRLTMFFRIALPLLWDNVQVAFVYLGIIALDFFAIINIMTPHPEAVGNSTEVIAHYLFTRAFSGDANPQYGYASAIGVMLFFLTLTLAAVMFRASRREKVEY